MVGTGEGKVCMMANVCLTSTIDDDYDDCIPKSTAKNQKSSPVFTRKHPEIKIKFTHGCPKRSQELHDQI